MLSRRNLECISPHSQVEWEADGSGVAVGL